MHAAPSRDMKSCRRTRRLVRPTALSLSAAEKSAPSASRASYTAPTGTRTGPRAERLGRSTSASGCRKASNLPEKRSLETSDNSYVIHLPRRCLHKKLIRLAAPLTHLFRPHSSPRDTSPACVDQQLYVLVKHP